MAIWLSTGGTAEYSEDQSARVFPDSQAQTQASRWGLFLHKFLVTPAVSAALKFSGIVAKFLGGHSIRKGSSTHCSSAVGGPSPTAVGLRADWDLGLAGRCAPILFFIDD